MKLHLTFVFFLASALVSSALAEIRPWKNTDASRSVLGEFVKRDSTSVTIKMEADKEVTIELTKLHPDEVKWLDSHHPVGATSASPDPTAFFDNLTFRDTRQSVEAKLKVSKLVKLTTDETFLGRSGLNGVFRMRQKLGSLVGYLYFDWTEANRLRELSLQTEPRPDTDYKTELEPSWKQLAELLTTLYGKPASKSPIPAMASLSDGTFSPTHLWNLERGGCATLGTARDGNRFQVVVRFSQKKPGVIGIP
jgi:hypothetical protein